MMDNPFYSQSSVWCPYKKKLLISSRESKVVKGRIKIYGVFAPECILFSCFTTISQKLTCDLRNTLLKIKAEMRFLKEKSVRSCESIKSILVPRSS